MNEPLTSIGDLVRALKESSSPEDRPRMGLHDKLFVPGEASTLSISGWLYTDELALVVDTDPAGRIARVMGPSGSGWINAAALLILSHRTAVKQQEC